MPSFIELLQEHHKLAQNAVPAAITEHANYAVAHGVTTPPVITVQVLAETSYWVVQAGLGRAVPCGAPSREFGSVQLIVTSTDRDQHQVLVEVGDDPEGDARYRKALEARKAPKLKKT